VLPLLERKNRAVETPKLAPLLPAYRQAYQAPVKHYVAMDATHNGAIFIVICYHNQCRYCRRIAHFKLAR
jgi:hypothetical protein